MAVIKTTEVDAWFVDYDNPQKELLLKIRDVVLSADPRMQECIKWKTPTFAYKGNLFSFNPRSKKHASLLFHTGASIEGAFPLLEGETPVARTAKIVDADQLEQVTEQLRTIVKVWCDTNDKK